MNDNCKSAWLDLKHFIEGMELIKKEIRIEDLKEKMDEIETNYLGEL